MCNRISGAILVAVICFVTWEISGMEHKQIVLHKDDKDAVVVFSILNMYGKHIKNLYCALQREACLLCESLQNMSLASIKNSDDKILSLYKEPERFRCVDNWEVATDESSKSRQGFLRSGDINRIKNEDPLATTGYFFCSAVIILSSLLAIGCCVSS